MLSLGAHRRTSRTALVLIQMLVFVTYIFGPAVTSATDPTPEPAPTESAAPSDPTEEPAATAAPTPTEAPAEPDPTQAPSSDPDPTAAPSDAPEPTLAPDPTPEPSSEADLSQNTRPYIVTFAAGTSDARQLEILDAASATDVSSIPQLNMRSVLLHESQYAGQVQALSATAEVARVEFDRTRGTDATASDAAFADQWSLPHIGWTDVYGGIPAPGGSTVVAVLDTGVDASHPDLDGVVLSGTSILDGSDGLADPNGHGTAMAGLVAAETDNGFGIAGAAWAGVSVLPVTVLGADGLGQDSDIIAGVVYAADAGADVILMAFSNPGFSPALQAAIDYAWSSGAVLVAAAGNDGATTNTFPAGDRGVIGVASTDSSDTLAASSNSGASVFLAAPGVDMPTTSLGGDVSTISGTSASAALVAGAAAQLRALDPAASNGAIVGRLARNADPTLSEGTGNGRLNLARAAADTSTDAIQPSGAAPVGDGGPLVGPYVAAAKTLTITIVGSGSVSWTGTADNNNALSGTCTATCTVAVGNNSSGTLTATAGSGATFSGWSNHTFSTLSASTSCSGTTSPCNYFMGTGGGSDRQITATFTAAAAVTSLSAANAAGTYGGSVNLSATLNAGSTGVSGKTISFSLNGSPVGTATTNSSGVATLSSVSLAGIDAGTYATGVGASFAGDATHTTSSGSASLTVNQKPITGSFTADNKIYDATTAATVLTRSLNGTVGLDDVELVGGTATFSDKNVANGKTVTLTGATLDGDDAGNYTLTSVGTTTANITQRALTVSATGVNKVYDGTTAATVTLSDNRVSGDVLTAAYTTATFADRHVGVGKTVSVAGISISGADAGNYSVNTSATTTANIAAATVTGSFTADNKVYDGTTAATILTRSITGGIVGTEDVTLTGGTASFANKDVGTGKTVTGTGFGLGGDDADNYVLGTVATTTADITALAITGSFTADNKVYDGTTAATVLTRDLTGEITDDDVTLSGGTAAFDNKNVGTGKTVTLTGATLSGADAPNYSLSSLATTTANIAAATVTGSFTADNKVYDGTTAATILTRSITGGIVGTEDVTLTGGTASFANKDVGTGKTVTGTGFGLGGDDADNYVLGTVATTTADITALNLTISGAVANSRVYNGTTGATVDFSAAVLVTPITDDDVEIDSSAYSASFADKHVGTGKAVTVSGVGLDGDDALNYTVSQPSGLSADITAKPITGNFTADNKVYDGTTDAEVLTRSLNDIVSGDSVSLTGGTAAFDTKNVGTGKTVTLSGASLSGTDAANYSLTSVGTATADISQRTLTVTATADNKTYDGNTAAVASLADDRVDGDDLDVTYTDADFDDKNVGTGKTVTVSGIAIDGGADAGNYDLGNTSTTATADITQRTLTVTATADNKTYDGSTAAVATLADNRVTDDDLDVSYASATFDTKNVGTGKTVTVSGIAIDGGADAGNYDLGNTSTTATADITQLAITGDFTADDKVYDGNTSATVTDRTLNGTVTGDDVSLSGGTAAFDTKNVGTGKTVTLSGASLTGADAPNYSLTSVATTTADITPKPITGNFTADNKVYDGTTDAEVLTRSLNDTVTDDDVALSGGTAAFDTKNVGTGKTVTLSGASLSGTDAANYSLTSVGTATADISQRTLTVTATADNKTYDGNTAAVATLADDRVDGDDLDVTYTDADFDDKNVGTGKTVTVSGIAIDGGADAGNYSLGNTTTTATANITPKTVNGSFTAADKVWDGNTSATITGRSLTGVVSGDDVSLIGGSATFDNPNVGTNKTVTGTGFSITGPDVGNYTLASSTLTTTASILAWSALGTGFYQPVGVPNSVFTPSGTTPNPPAVNSTTVWNTIKGGQTVPLKFNIFAGTVEQTDLADISAFTQTKLNSCTTGAGVDEVEETFLTTGGTTLRYSESQWIQNWKTPKVSSDTCYRATVTFADGSSLTAFFKVRK